MSFGSDVFQDVVQMRGNVRAGLEVEIEVSAVQTGHVVGHLSELHTCLLLVDPSSQVERRSRWRAHPMFSKS